MLYQSVTEICQNFLPSKLTKVQLFKPEGSEENMCKKEIRNPETNIPKTKKSVSTDVYIYRSSRERVFIPLGISQVSQASDSFTVLDNNVMKNNLLSTTIDNEELSTYRERITTHKEKDGNMKKIIACDNESTLMDSNMDSWKHIGNHMSKKRKSDNIEYSSLKIKRIQGSSNRRKATKFAKKKII